MSIEAMIIFNLMRLAGHIVRMEDNGLLKQLFYGELRTGERPQHKPRKRFKDNLKENLKALCINTQDWEKLALNRAQRKNSIKEGCSIFEDKRIKYAQIKRDLRKRCHPDLPADKQPWKCGMRDWVLLSKAGYVNYLKVHDNNPKTAKRDNLTPHLGNTTCVFCNKICKLSAGLKRRMLVHKNAVKQPDPVNPVKQTEFICHIWLKPMKSKAGPSVTREAMKGAIRQIKQTVRGGYHLLKL